MATTLSRRRRSAEDEPDEETPRRSRRTRDEEPDEDERPSRSRSRRSRDEDEDEAPRRSRRSRDDDDEKPSRSRRSRSRDEDEEDERPSRGRRGKATGGFGSYHSKRKSSSKFADEFKPESDKEVLIRFLDPEPFDVYNQHWINEMPKGERKSYVCLDDPEYFDGEDECPLCDIGDNPSTFSLFNILDLSNPRKPSVKVWKTSVTISDKLERMAESKKTSPLDSPELYFAVTMVKTKNKTTWDIQPVKARDLEEDFDMEPFDEDEIADFDSEKFNDRTAVTQVDSYDDLDEIAEGL